MSESRAQFIMLKSDFRTMWCRPVRLERARCFCNDSDECWSCNFDFEWLHDQHSLQILVPCTVKLVEGVMFKD